MKSYPVRWLTPSILAVLLLFPALLTAGEHRGTVRAADRPIPGAAITATQGGIKLVAYTDDAGQYAIELAPGEWDVQVDMFGFAPQRTHIEIKTGEPPVLRDWTLDMPKFGEPMPTLPPAASAPKTTAAAPEKVEAKPAETAAPTAPIAAAKPTETPKPATAAAKPDTNQRGRKPQPGAARPGFQTARVQATEEGEHALAEAAKSGPGAMAGGEEAEEAFLVSGSTSGGLSAASDEESKRQRAMSRGGDRGGPPGGPGDSMGMNMPPGMRGDNDMVGLGGLGTGALNAGFGDSSGGFGGPGSGGLGGPSMGGGRGDRGMGGGGGSGGGFGGGSGRNATASRTSTSRNSRGARGATGRGPYGGQYTSFGNKKRTEPLFNGSAFMNLNNSALNAAPFSINGKASQKPSYAQSSFGFSVGGPLIIPKFQKLQRASFYFTYQGSRSRNPYSSLSTVPTLDERNGDFTQAKANTTVTIYDPLSHLPFAGNIIPLARFDNAAKGLLKFIPAPTYAGIVQNYRLVSSTPNTSNNWGARLNLPLTRKDRINFNYQDQGRHSETQQLYGFRDQGNGEGFSASAGWSHSFAPRFNMSANLSISRNNNRNSPYFSNGENIAGLLGITGTSQDPVNYGPPNLSFTNFGSLSDGSVSLSRNQTVSFSDSITYVIKKKHNMTFGFSYRRMQQNSLIYQNARGAFTFSGLLTSGLDAAGQPLSKTGFDFADFLLGMPQSSSLRYGSDNNYFRGWSTNFYGQDDYRLTRRLSINLGLRYEYFSPYTELHGHLANLDLRPDGNAVAVVTPGNPAPWAGDLPDSLVRADSKNFSPRVGFAWRLAKKRSTMIRGGYSIFYSGSVYSGLASQLASQPPFARTTTISTSTAYPLTIQNGFPVVPAQTITNTYGINPDYGLSYAQIWNFAVQNSLPHGFFVEGEYIGTKGTGLSIVTQPNRAIGGSLLTAQQNLRIPNASGFSYQSAGANSSYNSGQVRLTRRFSRGMSGTALYMFSKAIDNASGFNGTGGSIMQFTDNMHLERGLSSFDQRHRLQASYMVSSPVGVHGLWRNGGLKTKLLTRWAMIGSFSATSGTPLTARVSGNLSNIGGTGAFGSGRAQATGQGIHDGDYPYFNLLAFTTPPAGQYGNAAKCTIPGLFRTSVNASLNRSFRMGADSRRQLQLRLSASNALNHMTITSIGTTVNSSTYGLPTGASSARVVTLLLRFNF